MHAAVRGPVSPGRWTAGAMPKQGEQGRWQRNGESAKSELNAAILRSASGKTNAYSTCKALRAGKRCLTVSAQHSSQDCAAYGHFHRDNQTTQAAFVCPRCGYQDSADANASPVIARRGVDQVLAGSCRERDR